MTEATKNQPTANSDTEPTAAQVSAYLLRNPDFFEQNQTLLTALSIPHTGTGKTVSLIEHQVKALRAENKQLAQQLNVLINNARTNDQLFDKAKTLILALISAQQLCQVSELVERSMLADFGSACCRLWLISGQAAHPAKQLILAQDAVNQLARLVKASKPYCGVLKAEESALLFPDRSDQVGSAAVLPLYAEHRLIGILAIANEDKNYYRDNMSTLLLTYIGEVVARIIYQLSGETT